MNKTQLKKWMGEQNAKIIALGNAEVMSHTNLRVELEGHDTVYHELGLRSTGTYADNIKDIVDEVIVRTQDHLEDIENHISDAVAYAVAEEVVKMWSASVKEQMVIISKEVTVDLKKYGGEGTVTMMTYVQDGNDLLSLDEEQVDACRNAIEKYLNEDTPKAKDTKVSEEPKKSSKQDIKIEKSFAGLTFTRVKNDKENYIKLRSANKLSGIIGGSVIGACAGLAAVGIIILAKSILCSNSSPVAESTEEA